MSLCVSSGIVKGSTMSIPNQDRLANSLLPLFVSILVVAGILFVSWLGYKITAARWPYARIPFSLLATGGIGTMLSGDIQVLASLLTYEGALSPVAANRVSWVSTVGVQIGGLALFTALCWLLLLHLQYPPGPSISAGPDRIRRRDIVVVSFFAALAVGTMAYSVLLWTSAVLVAIGVGLAILFLTFLIAFLIFSRTLRQRGTSG